MTIAIHQVRLIDGTGDLHDNATLLVRGTKILAVGPSNEVRIPKGAIRIDGRGLSMIPGLIDCHVHLCLGGEPDVVGTLESEQPPYTLLKSAMHAKATIEARLYDGARRGISGSFHLHAETGYRFGPRCRGHASSVQDAPFA